MYLFDTSVLSDYTKVDSPYHAAAVAFVNGNISSMDQVNICAVSVGEVGFGRELLMLRRPLPSQQKIDEVDATLAALKQFAQSLPITHHVAREYGCLRAAYANGVVPNLLGKKLKGKAVELWHQHVPPSLLHITENDLWIAAVAITHDLILVTRDKDFDSVKRHCNQLKLHRI